MTIKIIKWTTKEIDSIKAEVRQEVLDLVAAHGEKESLKILKDKIFELSRDEDAMSLARLLITIFNALSLHVRAGGFSASEIQKSVDLAYAILQKAQIQPIKSKLAFLYGELHLIKSNIAYQEGDIWGSTWQLQTAMRLSSAAPAGGVDYQHLTLALRCMRLGHSTIALQNFRVAEALQMEGNSFEIARIGQIRALRFLGEFDEMKKLIAATRELSSLSQKFELELQWELCCADVYMNGDLAPMMLLVRSGKSHYLPSYLLEAYFWAQAVSSTRWLQDFPRLQALFRRPSLHLRKDSLSYKIALTFDDCHDQAIPFQKRYVLVEELFTIVSELESVDKQLLCWLAIARWLSRNMASRLAKLVMAEYEALCMKVSCGRNKDIFGIAQDLTQKAWYLSQGSQDQEDEDKVIEETS